MKNRTATVLASSRIFLFAVWLTALASVPGFRSYQDQLDSGVDPAKIATVYGSISVIVTVSSIGAWIYTSRWLREAVDTANLNVPGTVRLHRGWALWGWVVPIVSLWFPRMIVKDVLKSKQVTDVSDGINLNTWWMTWLMYSLLNSSQMSAQLLDSYLNKTPTNPIHPEMEIAGACLFTASYLVWQKIVVIIGGDE